MLGTAGVTLMDNRAAGVMLRVVDPETPPKVALTVVPPTAMLEARPLLLTVATLGMAVLQRTEPLRSKVLPSV
jgi:hypothetical protein